MNGMTGFGNAYRIMKIKTLNYEKLDTWGLPTVEFDCEFKDNEKEMRKDMQQEAVKMFEMAGSKI